MFDCLLIDDALVSLLVEHYFRGKHLYLFTERKKSIMMHPKYARISIIIRKNKNALFYIHNLKPFVNYFEL